MCGCESWTVKKAERLRIDAFELWHDSWEEVKISIFPALMDDFEEITSSVEEVTTDVMEIAREQN